MLSDLGRTIKWLGYATAVLFLALVALSGYVYFHGRSINHQQDKVIKLLCNRSYNLSPIVDDITSSIIAAAADVIAARRKAGLPDDPVAVALLLRLQDDHVRLQDLLLQRDTPCRKVP